MGLKVRNSDDTPVKEILEQFAEPRPLPMGMTEFEEWSDRIISGALVPSKDIDVLKGSLAYMILHLGPTESHKPDAYFIHSLRKAAVNEVANAVFKEKKAICEARAAKEKAEAPADNVTSIQDAKH